MPVHRHGLREERCANGALLVLVELALDEPEHETRFTHGRFPCFIFFLGGGISRPLLMAERIGDWVYALRALMRITATFVRAIRSEKGPKKRRRQFAS